MPKAASPVRLQEELMESARISGSIQHRSTAEQIEYWADIGRKVARSIDPDTLLAVEAGLARLVVEQVHSEALNAGAVFASLEADRKSGKLASLIMERSPIRYQASRKQPGQLEQIDAQGNSIIGQFVDGEFVPSDSA